MITKQEKKIYEKSYSFENFISKSKQNLDQLKSFLINLIEKKLIENKFENSTESILKQIKIDLSDQNTGSDRFSLRPNVIDELKLIEEKQITDYLVGRYRYEVFPQKKYLEKYPPLLQIEPTSICNYRCVFCFETDTTFTKKENGYMGQMQLELFKQVVDEAEGKIPFITLASRGEPLACKNIEQMLEYTNNKFLNIKMNTNASLMTEKKAHAILSSGINTLIFSADAADDKLYSELRVNGKLKTVLKNIENFNNLHAKEYSKKKIITRVSGVKVNASQKIEDMEKLWKDLVDQVAFVKYNPWENSYTKKANDIVEPCSDLWRRMFIWWDGLANPCDVDYKSKLQVGRFPDNKLDELWNSNIYNELREKHLNSNRKSMNPCASCIVT
mgnify:CR=1 FL=1